MQQRKAFDFEKEKLTEAWKEETKRFQEKDMKQREDLLRYDKKHLYLLNQKEKIEKHQLEKICTLTQQNKLLNVRIEVKNRSILNWESKTSQLTFAMSRVRREKNLIQKELEEETRPKNIIRNSPLQKFVDGLPKPLQSVLAPKGSVRGDELGVFLGSLVTTTAYNVTYANKSVKGLLIVNCLANLLGTIIGQVCNNVVNHISHTNVQEEGMQIAVAFKSVFWILLGGLIPAIAGGVCKPYLLRAVVSALVALLMKVVMAMIWLMSYKVPFTQVGGIVVFGILGIVVAAAIPHIVKTIGN